MKRTPTTASERLTLADLVVLAMLTERPTHGYELVAELERREVSDWAAVSRAQIYYSLKKLAGLKLVVAAEDQEPAAGPERDRFRVSAAGRRAMSAALAREHWACQRPPLPFHTWLALVAMDGPGDRRSVLEARARFLDEQIEKEVRTLEAIRNDPGPTQAMALAIVSHAIKVFRLERDLLKRVEPLLA
ncbi:MAG: helix-turn-helix transcriptional regulator [Planctomycetes bacterium]|nr:helix-turn-helix transcriptional regulator [Planctomycetota bacterium]